MSFKDVLGQEEVIDRLKKSIRNRSVPHAYIFEGIEGVGKKTTAFNFAKALFCQGNQEESCDNCISCKKMDHGNYPDYYLISPEDKNILDSQVEEIQKIISKKSKEGKGSVIIIEKAESMTVRAQNRILKTMEEPIGNAHFILVTINASSLLDTIQSRCVIMKFRGLDRKMIQNYLVERHAVDENKAAMLAVFSQGSLGKSLKLCQSEEFMTIRQESIKASKILGSIKDADLYAAIKIFEGKKDVLIEFLDMIEYWYRDILILQASGSKEIITNIDYIHDIINQAAQITLKKSIKVIESLEQAKKDYTMNINYHLLIKNMVLRMQEG